MKLSLPALRNTPWFKATSGQWRYALRNTIAMCLALTFAYYLNLDEPYWAMTDDFGRSGELSDRRRRNQ